jgi:hypothetical protein
MEKVYKIIKKPLVKADFGIEIECEGKNLPFLTQGYWHSEDDGSLRGVYPDSRCEYVLSKPIPFRECAVAIQELVGAMKTNKATPVFSFRTSVHIHMNVGDYTEEQLLNLIYTYLLLEEALINYCGKERKGNRFCLRLNDAEAILETLQMFVNRDLGYMIRNANLEQSVRYASINLAAIAKYGSLEFRGMRGTLDEGVLNNWIGILWTMGNWAKAKNNIIEIYELFCELGSIEFLKHVVGDYSPLLLYPKLKQDMERSLSLSLDLPHKYSMRKLKKDESLDNPFDVPQFFEVRIEPGLQPAPRWRVVQHREELAPVEEN